MVGVTSQGSGAGEWSDQARDQSRVSNESDRNRNREQEQDTGPRRNTHQGRVCRSGHPLNTSV
ncbi:unnamed protein product [Staurois parvus]|uniref:Uncharacterized protein n=1 Tax=Staurois parvus TaxID=386267 RepID=A0ABN9GKN7_9NEOB|nr:unnamed protein product [Staurois parvus]